MQVSDPEHTFRGCYRALRFDYLSSEEHPFMWHSFRCAPSFGETVSMCFACGLAKIPHVTQ